MSFPHCYTTQRRHFQFSLIQIIWKFIEIIQHLYISNNNNYNSDNNKQQFPKTINFQQHPQATHLQCSFNVPKPSSILEFIFIYNDLKQQLKQMPHLQQLLRLTEKSTRKLQCINLYSISDKRQFDLEIEEQQIFKEINGLSAIIRHMQDAGSQGVQQIQDKMNTIKNKNIQTFDLLNKQDELLTQQISLVQYILDNDIQTQNQNQIKQQDEYDEQNMKDSNPSNQSNPLSRIPALKKQLQQISQKISKINNGRGKWYQSDHNDFVKIYNKCGGNDKKIIDEGVKVLGMKNIQIVDHLEIYENYLQLEKEKKIISEEYREIKLYEKMEEDEKKEQLQKVQQEKNKQKKQRQMEQNQKNRQLIQKFKQKKQQQKIKLLQQQQKKQKQKIVKVPLPPSKKKQILQRNQKYIAQKQNNFKKNQQQKIAANAVKNTFSLGKERDSDRDRLGSKQKLTKVNLVKKQVNQVIKKQ